MRKEVVCILGFLAGVFSIWFLDHFSKEIKMLYFLFEAEARMVRSIKATGEVPESLDVLPESDALFSGFKKFFLVKWKNELSYTVNDNSTITLVNRGEVMDVVFEMSRTFDVAPYLKAKSEPPGVK